MQNPLMFLKSLFATWPSSSSTSWVIGTILPFLCGLGLFLLRLPSLQRNPSSRPPCERRNIRKRQVEPRGKSSRSRKKRGALKASSGAEREEQQEQEEKGSFESLQSWPEGPGRSGGPEVPFAKLPGEAVL
nr:PREDICTED: spermatogenesis-associated protein 31-like [Equus przewalskii]